ncbi:MAG: metal ABC transporter solute-binding protein, Zn/Mn family [Anaerolineae bacterium]
MKRYLWPLMLVAVFVLAACAPAVTPPPVEPTAAPAAAARPLNVTVSILPQKYFVERVGGAHVKVNVMVEPGASPATYEPKPEQMAALAQADAYVSIGVPFEKAWLAKMQAVNPKMKLVDTTQGIERKATPNGGFDPHIWLSPSLVKIQAQTIYAALAELDPAHQAAFKANLDAFLADIDKLDAEIRATLAQTKAKKFIVFHPAWGYFARDYGLEQVPIEVGGQEPSAQELAQLIAKAKSDNIKVVFAQPEFSQEDAKTIAREIGGEVILISPLNPDWLANLQTVAKTFAAVLNK